MWEPSAWIEMWEPHRLHLMQFVKGPNNSNRYKMFVVSGHGSYSWVSCMNEGSESVSSQVHSNIFPYLAFHFGCVLFCFDRQSHTQKNKLTMCMLLSNHHYEIKVSKEEAWFDWKP